MKAERAAQYGPNHVIRIEDLSPARGTSHDEERRAGHA
jgi:hypothetical protein